MARGRQTHAGHLTPALGARRVDLAAVSPGYFGALRLRVTSERPLTDGDTMSAPQAIVVSRSFDALLLGGFAMFALAIAGVGLVGVLSYSVAQRTREIGVRTALGAQTRDIVRMVFRQGLAIAGAGVAIGLLMSAAAVRSLSAFLYGVAAYDAASFIVVPVVLAAAVVVACLVPARRAASIDPLRALREA